MNVCKKSCVQKNSELIDSTTSVEAMWINRQGPRILVVKLLFKALEELK